MKFVKNKILPFKGFRAVTIYPFVFHKKKLSETTINHENIHGQQQKELLIIPFYIIYLIEAIFKGYKDISFEVEAYKHASNLEYLKSRKRFAMWRK